MDIDDSLGHTVAEGGRNTTLTRWAQTYADGQWGEADGRSREVCTLVWRRTSVPRFVPTELPTFGCFSFIFFRALSWAKEDTIIQDNLWMRRRKKSIRHSSLPWHRPISMMQLSIFRVNTIVVFRCHDVRIIVFSFLIFNGNENFVNIYFLLSFAVSNMFWNKCQNPTVIFLRKNAVFESWKSRW